jgi:hypothetical protein
VRVYEWFGNRTLRMRVPRRAEEFYPVLEREAETLIEGRPYSVYYFDGVQCLDDHNNRKKLDRPQPSRMQLPLQPGLPPRRSH